jgi:predicted nucleic acid-binding protein
MFLVDTDVISEARKGRRANPGVLEFLAQADPSVLYMSVQAIGEIRRGVESLKGRGDAPQAQLLENWLHLVVTEYADRLLDFDVDCAQVWGKLMSPHPQHAIDKQIAAIALIHDLTVVTGNTKDFEDLGVRLHNPFFV